MKIKLLLLSLVFSIICVAQNTMIFRGYTLNVADLKTKLGQPLTDTVIKYSSINSDISVPKIVTTFNSKFGSSYLSDILTGDVEGKDVDIVQFINIMTCTDLNIKMMLCYKLNYENCKNTSCNIDSLMNTICSGMIKQGYENIIVQTQQVEGILLAYNQNNGIAILYNGGMTYICDMYTLLKKQ